MFSCGEKEKDKKNKNSTQKTLENGLITGTITFTGDEQGYSFEKDKIYKMSSSWAREGKKLNYIDIAWSDFNLATPILDGKNGIMDFRLHHMGTIDFDNLSYFEVDSEDYWKWAYGRDDGNNEFKDHVFILKTHKGTYVKFIVKNIDRDSQSIDIEYIHQPNGTKSFQ
jgi:hypothetical protein